MKKKSLTIEELRKIWKSKGKGMKKINRFTGKYAFLSNFYYSPFKTNINFLAFNIFEINNPELAEFTFQTAEHFYQAFKAKNLLEFMNIVNAPIPELAKFLGNKIELREDWDEIKDDVMLQALSWKFITHKDLSQKLIETGDTYLEEGNYWHDNYWGNCYCEKCKNIEGENRLGEMLIFIREIAPGFLLTEKEREESLKKTRREFLEYLKKISYKDYKKLKEKWSKSEKI